MTAFTTVNIVKIHHNDGFALQLTAGSWRWPHKVVQLKYSIPLTWLKFLDTDDDDNGRINFNVAYSPKTARTRDS